MQYPLNAGRVAAVVFALGGLSILYFYVLGSMNASHAPTRVMVPVTTGDTESTTSKSTKSYQSASLNIAFEYPGEYVASEKFTDIVLKKQASASVVQITKYGSQYLNVEDHVNNLISKWQIKPNERSVFVGDNLQGEYLIKNGVDESQKIIFYVKEFFIYQFETNDPELFSDLDTIARSFKILE